MLLFQVAHNVFDNKDVLLTLSYRIQLLCLLAACESDYQIIHCALKSLSLTCIKKIKGYLLYSYRLSLNYDLYEFCLKNKNNGDIFNIYNLACLSDQTICRFHKSLYNDDISHDRCKYVDNILSFDKSLISFIRMKLELSFQQCQTIDLKEARSIYKIDTKFLKLKSQYYGVSNGLSKELVLHECFKKFGSYDNYQKYVNKWNSITIKKNELRQNRLDRKNHIYVMLPGIHKMIEPDVHIYNYILNEYGTTIQGYYIQYIATGKIEYLNMLISSYHQIERQQITRITTVKDLQKQYDIPMIIISNFVIKQLHDLFIKHGRRIVLPVICNVYMRWAQLHNIWKEIINVTNDDIDITTWIIRKDCLYRLIDFIMYPFDKDDLCYKLLGINCK